MMNNSNYSIGLQRLKPVHTAYCGLLNLAENWSWGRDVNGRDRDETETLTIFLETRPRRDVGTCRDRLETETSSRPSRDRDVETETTTLPRGCTYNLPLWIKPPKFFSSRPGGAPAPTAPLGYAYIGGTGAGS